MTENTEKKYTVGQMAEICNISAKILRFYDRSEVLIPAYREESNRYRYYSEEQIAQVLLLQELRELNFPVKVIRKLFVNRDIRELETELERRMKELRAEEELIRKKYDRTQDLFLRAVRGSIAIAQSKDRLDVSEMSAIQTVRFHERCVAYTRYISSWNAKQLFISRRAELLKLIADHQYETTGANMAVFHSGYMDQFSDSLENSDGDLEVFIEVTNGKPGPNCREMEAFDAVSSIFVGPYSDMKRAYHRLENYAALQGLELEGISIEEYLVGATMTDDPDNYVTRIYLPLKRRRKK